MCFLFFYYLVVFAVTPTLGERALAGNSPESSASTSTLLVYLYFLLLFCLSYLDVHIPRVGTAAVTVGTPVSKKFGGRPFYGDVTQVTTVYRVVFTNGDGKSHINTLTTIRFGT